MKQLKKLLAAIIGHKYYAVTSLRIGINQDGLMQPIFPTYEAAKEYEMWLKLNVQTYQPTEIISFRSFEVYECCWVNN